MTIQLITNKKGLRPGNLIFVDNFVFPPNFICAQPARLPFTDFEEVVKEPLPRNWAYLNLDLKTMRQLLFPWREDKGIYRHSVKLFYAKHAQIQPKDDFIKWTVSYGRQKAELQFVHELQNIFKDWTGEELLKFAK